MKTDVTQQLQNHVSAIRKGAELVVNSINDWQVIRQFLSNRSGGLALTDIQQAKLDRYNFMYNQLASGNFSEYDVVEVVSKKYEITIQQGYEDLACTKEIYSTLFNFNKAFELRIQLDLNRIMLKKAEVDEDYIAYASLEKNRIKLMQMIPEMDLDENWFEPHQNIIEFNPELIGAEQVDMQEVLNYINEKRKLKINTALFDEAEKVDDASTKSAL